MRAAIEDKLQGKNMLHMMAVLEQEGPAFAERQLSTLVGATSTCEYLQSFELTVSVLHDGVVHELMSAAHSPGECLESDCQAGRQLVGMGRVLGAWLLSSVQADARRDQFPQP